MTSILVLYVPYYADAVWLLLAGDPVLKESPGVLLTLSIGAGLSVLPAVILFTCFLACLVMAKRSSDV